MSLIDDSEFWGESWRKATKNSGILFCLFFVGGILTQVVKMMINFPGIAKLKTKQVFDIS